MSKQVMIVLGRHRPHEVLFLAFSLGWGVAYLVGSPAPTSMAAIMPLWVVRSWAAGLLLSGMVGLAAIVLVRKSTERALLLEQAAMLLGAGALVVFAAAAWTYAGWPATFAVGSVLAWAAANVWRAVQIRRDLDGLVRRIP